MGWNSYPTSGILVIADGNGTDLNLFYNYGHLSASEITTYETTYANEDTRDTQNNDQLYHCLKNSLSASGTSNIIAESTKYHIVINPCVYILFKLIPQKSIIDIRVTASKMIENLSSLDTYIATVNSNIEIFNEYVKINYEALTTRGKRCDDMMLYMFKVYIQAVDKDFVS